MAPSPKDVHQLLSEHYDVKNWWPKTGPLDVFVGAILTQQANWKNVQMALENLWDAGKLTLPDLASMPRQELEELIKPSGFFRQKAGRLQTAARYILESYGSIEAFLSKPTNVLRQDLLSLKGIGKETADSIMLYGGKHPVLVVDAYTRRMGSRLGWFGPKAGYDEMQEYLESRLDRGTELYQEFHAIIVEHCKTYCLPKPLCGKCPLKHECPFGERF